MVCFGNIFQAGHGQRQIYSVVESNGPLDFFLFNPDIAGVISVDYDPGDLRGALWQFILE